jgi:cytochrome c biogenesis protein CcdA
MDMRWIIALAVFLALLPGVGLAQEPLRVDLFYAPGCPHCATVQGYLEGYIEENPGVIELVRHDVSVNASLFIEMQQSAGVPVELWGGVPKVFVGDYYCIGSGQCHTELLEKLDELSGSGGNSSHAGGGVEINPYQILGLAAVDAVNPCALAVLTLILIAILTQNPEKRRRVLTAGLAFTAAIYLTYLLYGVVIIQLFKAALDVIAESRFYLYGVLGIAAIVLGLLNFKDFFWYREGGIMTEMPMSWRPRLKSIISSATGTRGAFLIGIFVTLFLLPCTIGPYIITGGILSSVPLLETIPWLVLYNLIFVMPMVAITLVIYAGFTTVENVSGWKEKNIRYLHGIAGIIMILLGLAMVLGLI